MGLKENEGETIFTVFDQAELLKDFHVSIFCGYDARPTPTLPVTTVVMPVPHISMPVLHREHSGLGIS